MNRLPVVCGCCLLALVACYAADAPQPKVLLEEKFDGPLSADWQHGLGTWTAKDGILRGFESGKRRHGPVKPRTFAFKDAVFEFEYRLEGKANRTGIVFNGAAARGHVANVALTLDGIQLADHPKKGEAHKLADGKKALKAGEWHTVRVVVKGQTMTATVDGTTVSGTSETIAEPKANFAFAGNSGGPTGEQAGALEFRKLRVTEVPAED